MIDIVAETASTNADMVHTVSSGGVAPHEGYWRVADRQTGGRGRLGRSWQDGVGNFMGSTLVHLGAGDPPAHSLGLVCGVAVHRAVEALVPPDFSAYHAQLAIKWPNDLLYGQSKMAGILAERVRDAVIVGVGVNLRSAPQIEGRLTCALADFGIDIDRDVFARRLAGEFAQLLTRWRCGGWPGPILDEWMARAHAAGTMLTVSDGAQAGLTGAFEGLDGDGGLRLRLSNGQQEVIHAGDVQRT